MTAKTTYKVFNTFSGGYEEAETYDDALQMRLDKMKELITRNIDAFPISRVDHSEDGAETWSTLDLSDKHILILHSNN